MQSDQCDRSTSDNPARPPDAFVAPTGGGGPVAGKLGSFTYCDIAADALPPRAENVEALALGQPPTVVMSSGGAFTAYRAAYWPASEWQGDPVQLAQADTLAPATTAEFNGPPAGDWVLAIHVTFGQEGNATYYWHVTVP